MTEENQDLAPEDMGEGAPLSHSKGRRAFTNLRRELSDEELSSPAVQRMLIDEIERIEQDNMKLRGLQDAYYRAERNSAILEEKLKNNLGQEVIFGVCLTVGAALISLSPFLWEPEPQGMDIDSAGSDPNYWRCCFEGGQAMKIEFQSIVDKGVHQKERLVLKVMADTDIGDYLIIQTGFNNGEVTIRTYHCYWFPYKSVSAGDIVVLYTKLGKTNERDLGNGRKVHFFYWDIESAIWNVEDRSPVVLHAPEWVSKSPDEL